MANENRIHIAINVPKITLNSALEKWLQEMMATTIAIPEIGKIVVRRLPRHENDIEPDAVLNQMSPWVVGFPYLPLHPKGVVKNSLGWWWNLGLHFAFKTEPYPDYVLHWPFDMEWQPGDGNTMASRDKIRAFLRSDFICVYGSVPRAVASVLPIRSRSLPLAVLIRRSFPYTQSKPDLSLLQTAI